MAYYTTTIKAIMTQSETTIFDFEYPIFDESYRSVLENKIIQHYYMREIGFETVGLFKQQLASKLNLIMPNYNKLYLASKLDVDVIIKYKQEKEYTRTGKGDSTSQTDNSSSATGTSKNVFEDTPEGSFQISEGYATNINQDETQASNQSDSSNIQEVNNTEDYLETIIRNNPNISETEQIKKYADSLLNVDLMIINELNELFMCIY